MRTNTQSSQADYKDIINESDMQLYNRIFDKYDKLKKGYIDYYDLKYA